MVVIAIPAISAKGANTFETQNIGESPQREEGDSGESSCPVGRILCNNRNLGARTAATVIRQFSSGLAAVAHIWPIPFIQVGRRSPMPAEGEADIAELLGK